MCSTWKPETICCQTWKTAQPKHKGHLGKVGEDSQKHACHTGFAGVNSLSMLDASLLSLASLVVHEWLHLWFSEFNSFKGILLTILHKALSRWVLWVITVEYSQPDLDILITVVNFHCTLASLTIHLLLLWPYFEAKMEVAIHGSAVGYSRCYESLCGFFHTSLQMIKSLLNTLLFVFLWIGYPTQCTG